MFAPRKTSATKLFGATSKEEKTKEKEKEKEMAKKREHAELVEAATLLQSQARAFLDRSAANEKVVQLNQIYQEDIAGVPSIVDGTMRSSGEGRLETLNRVSTPLFLLALSRCAPSPSCSPFQLSTIWT